MSEPVNEIAARYLDANAEALVDSWIDWIRDSMPTRTMEALPAQALCNHLPPILHGLANSLRSPLQLSNERLLGHLRMHGQIRRDQGYTLEEVIAEQTGLSEVVARGVSAAIVAKAPDAPADEVVEILNRLASGLRSISFMTVAVFSRTNHERDTQDAAQMGEFSDAICHELRNPLNTINLGLQLLKAKGDDPATLTSQFDAMSAAVDRCTDLLDTIRTLSLTESARAGARLVALEQGISQVTREFAATAAAAEVELRGPGGELPQVHIEGPLLYFLLANTVGNAIKYHDAGKDKRWVQISAQLEDEDQDTGFCRIDVEDNGIGIAAEMIPRVTQRRFRAQPDLAHGTGLGLYIVHEAIAQRGGKLKIESEEGKGTRVSMWVRCLRDQHSSLTPGRFSVEQLMGEVISDGVADWPEIPGLDDA